VSRLASIVLACAVFLSAAALAAAGADGALLGDLRVGGSAPIALWASFGRSARSPRRLC
jgi:hypothetical protein